MTVERMRLVAPKTIPAMHDRAGSDWAVNLVRYVVMGVDWTITARISGTQSEDPSERMLNTLQEVTE